MQLAAIFATIIFQIIDTSVRGTQTNVIKFADVLTKLRTSHPDK